MSKDIKKKITHCEVCGVELTYTTKKKRWCKEHNPYNDVVIYRGQYVTTKSKLENQVLKWIMELMPQVPFIAGGYYSWLPSPKGYPLQLDLFVYGVKGLPAFAIEVDGIQHEEKQSFQTAEDFNYLQKCDKLKDIVMANKGYKLLRISTLDCKTKEDFIKILESNGIYVDQYNGHEAEAERGA